MIAQRMLPDIDEGAALLVRVADAIRSRAATGKHDARRMLRVAFGDSLRFGDELKVKAGESAGTESPAVNSSINPQPNGEKDHGTTV
ncbi:MAG: hypothetical protein NTZ32_22000 [Planctomycetales bacterium]|nr:hypothetical protein [Planctomycetales bacterium]